MEEQSDRYTGSSPVPLGTCPNCSQRLERNQINYLRWFSCPCCGVKLAVSRAHRKFPNVFAVVVLAAAVVYSFTVRDIMLYLALLAPVTTLMVFLIYRMLPMPRLRVYTHDPDEEVQTLGLTK